MTKSKLANAGKVCLAYLAAWSRRLGPFLMVGAVAIGIYAATIARQAQQEGDARARINDIAQVLNQRDSCEFGNEGRRMTRLKDVEIPRRVQERVIGDLAEVLKAEDSSLLAAIAAQSAAEEAAEVTNELTPEDRDCVAAYPPPEGISEDEMVAAAEARD